MRILLLVSLVTASAVLGYFAEVHEWLNPAQFWALGAITGIIVGILIGREGRHGCI